MKPKRPVFIGGCSRSGTTFLGSLLGAHERCLCTPESHFIINILNQANQSGYYDDYKKLFFDITHNFRFRIWETKLPFESINQCNYSQIVQNILNLYMLKTEKHHADIWIDHTPSNLMFADILSDHFHKAKFIHIIRDGRAIVASVKRKRWGDPTPIHLAAIWINNLAYGFAAENLLPAHKIIRVKYEDLVISTENEIKRICNFIGITFSERMLKGDGFLVPNYTKEQHLLVGKPAQSDRIDRWKKELSTKEIEVFEYYTGRMLSMLEYDTLTKHPKMPSFMDRLILKIKGHVKSVKGNVYRNKKKCELRGRPSCSEIEADISVSKPITVVQYWAGCPKSPNSKWQSFLAIIKRCQEQGWRNCLVWSRMPENPALIEPFREAGCEIILQPQSRRNFDIACVWRTYRLLRRLNCDVFHCYNYHTSPLIGAFLARVTVRIWSKLAMSPYYEQGISPRGLNRLMASTRISGWCAHRILAISEKVRLELVESGVSGKHIDTVYVPVDYHRFADAAKGNLRQELGFDRSHIIITSVGRAVPVKGWDVAMKAFVQVYQQIPNARMVLVGDRTSSEYYNQLIRLIKQYEMEENIKLTGKRDDIPEVLKASDVFILPSRSEGMPAALIEAMAAGLFCVATRVGGIPEVITHDKDGLLFERENVEELAGHLVRLIQAQTLRMRIASEASNRAATFNMKTYVDKVFECYKALLAHNCARDPVTATAEP